MEVVTMTLIRFYFEAWLQFDPASTPCAASLDALIATWFSATGYEKIEVMMSFSRKSFDTSYKLKTVESAEKFSKKAAARDSQVA